MRIWFILGLVYLPFCVTAQDSISFEQLTERYDTSEDHSFLRHIYKNLRHPEEYGQKGNLALVEVKYISGSWEISLLRSYYPSYDTFIVDIMTEASEYLIKPSHPVVTVWRMKFDYLSNDYRKNTNRYTIV